jgi:capsular exopolysaccharide synthesis family protein
MLFLGAGKGCGVSTAATNLAASLAQNTRARVLLIDANVRSQRSSTLVSQASASGTDEVDVSLRRLLTDAPVLQDPAPGPSNLYVLPSGVPCYLPLSVFQSRRFKELLQKARQLFQYVVIDGPSIGEHPEALLLSRKADGVILVVESERTRKQSALWAKRQIEMAGGTLLGVILNKRKHRIPQWLYKRV